MRSRTIPAVCVAVLVTVALTHWMTDDAPAQFGGFGPRGGFGGPGSRSLQSATLILQPMIGDSAGTWLAFGRKTGQWTRHSFPPEQNVSPVTGGSVAAFSAEGDRITELVAVDEKGHFRPHRLPHSTNSPCSPTVGASVACYSLDGRVYAFSSVTGTWDSIASKGASVVSSDVVVIQFEKSIAAFSAETGKWAVASLVAGDSP